jgi:hypothetical protein
MYWLANLAAQHGKQVIVGEWGVATGSGSNGGGDNANYIQWMYETFQSWYASGRIKAEYYFADDCGGGNVDSDLINCNPNARARYVSLYSGSGGGDTQAPTIPSGLASSGIAETGFTLTWTASTDNVGVTGYEVFRNGTSVGTPTSTSFSVSGLTCNTAYSMTVRARDAAGNWSAQSTALNVTTSACSGGGSNLALNKPATASSVQSPYTANLAVDGNTTTRWGAAFTGDPQWIYVDLGATNTVNRVVLIWEAAYADQYQIQVSRAHDYRSPLQATA